MPLHIQYVSDLHLEFTENYNYLQQHPIVPAAPILVMAGDITLFNQLPQHMDYFKMLAQQFETIYWLPGNHEYYNYDLVNKEGSFCEAILPNLFLVNNYSVVHQQCKLIFSQLWSHISPRHQLAIEAGLNDFNYITYNGNRLTTAVFNAQHFEALACLRKEIAQSQQTHNLVFTHTVPTFMNYPEPYKSDPIQEAFAVELHDFIDASNISHWVYGHSHFNIPDFNINNTTLHTNQLCYVKWNEHQGFKANSVLTIN